MSRANGCSRIAFRQNANAPRLRRATAASPTPGITVEDRVRDFRTDPAAAVFPHYEKLGHVPIYGKTAVRVVVNQHETREISAQPYEQRNALLVVPVRFEIRIFRKQPVVAQFASLHVRPLF
jgi:hypothetical protein